MKNNSSQSQKKEHLTQKNAVRQELSTGKPMTIWMIDNALRRRGIICYSIRKKISELRDEGLWIPKGLKNPGSKHYWYIWVKDNISMAEVYSRIRRAEAKYEQSRGR